MEGKRLNQYQLIEQLVKLQKENNELLKEILENQKQSKSLIFPTDTKTSSMMFGKKDEEGKKKWNNNFISFKSFNGKIMQPSQAEAYLIHCGCNQLDSCTFNKDGFLIKLEPIEGSDDIVIRVKDH